LRRREPENVSHGAVCTATLPAHADSTPFRVGRCSGMRRGARRCAIYAHAAAPPSRPRAAAAQAIRTRHHTERNTLAMPSKTSTESTSSVRADVRCGRSSSRSSAAPRWRFRCAGVKPSAPPATPSPARSKSQEVRRRLHAAYATAAVPGGGRARQSSCARQDLTASDKQSPGQKKDEGAPDA
jgi:hypothetical protein